MKYSNKYYHVQIYRSCNKFVNIICKLKNIDPNFMLTFAAANPPDYRQSYSGSALPFPDAEIAFENTPNYGMTSCNKEIINIRLQFPNSYYSHVGTRLILPYVKINIFDGNKKIISSDIINLGEIAPFRLLTYPSLPKARDSPTFYLRDMNTKPRTQEDILRSSGYTMYTPNNFWGNSIPN